MSVDSLKEKEASQNFGQATSLSGPEVIDLFFNILIFIVAKICFVKKAGLT